MADRKMTLTNLKLAGIASAMMLASTNVAALGLGALDVQSNLDQPLSGVIELRVADNDDVSTVTASIASRSDFESLGIDYPDYLSDINLRVDTSDRSNAVLRVDSSNVVIKEPFIHFLVRVDWSGGSFLREYTALIDPPVYAAETPKSISQPKSVGTDQSYQDSSSVIEETDIDVNDSIDDVVSDTEDEANEFYTPSAVGSGPTDARYGPVANGESLSVIASELQKQFPDLSIYQIMKVLFEENQDAFIDGNINGLIRGTVLNIGDLDQIRAVDIEESKAFFTQQLNDWDPSVLEPAPSSVRVSQDEYGSNDDYADSSSSGNEFGTGADSFQVGSSTDTQEFVSNSSGGSNEGEVIALREQIIELEAAVTSGELENQELKERISILEGQLADMNELIKLGESGTVESTDMAIIQDTLGDLNEQGDEVAVTGDLIATEELDSSVDLANEFINDTASDIEDTISDASTDVADSGDELASVLDDAVDGLNESETVSDVVPAPSTTVTTPIQPESKSFIDKAKSMLFDGGLLPIIGGVGALLVGGIVALFLRRRKADEEFEISMLSIESNSQSVDTVDSASLSKSMSASVTASIDQDEGDKETSFLTVYSDSDAVVQADEVDPIAEADVYIAYGRDEQAEEVLLDGVVANPDRLDIKHKLLGLYHKNNNVEGFERIAEELYAQRETLNSDIWQDVCRMGKEVSADNPLFEVSSDDIEVASQAEAEGADQHEGDESVTVENVGTDDELSIDEVSVDEMPVDGDDASDESIQLINFDEGRSEISELDEVAIDALDLNNDVADNVPMADLDADDQTDSVEDDSSELDISTDLDFSDVDFTTELDNEPDVSADIDFNSELDEVSLSDGDDDLLEFVSDSTADVAEDELELSIDEVSELTLDDVSIVPTVEADSEISLDFVDEDEDDEADIGDLQEVSDLEIDEDYDEARTQYELAKVFVDLGDEDGARKILSDIVANKENSADVISDSQALLNSIS